jgi:tyrosinase
MKWARGVFVMASTLAVAGTAAAQAPQVRMRWQDFVAGPDGAKRLASLEAAIKKMKSLDGSAPGSADFRRSWQYWANIHGYYGSTSPDGTVEQQIAYLKQQGMGQYASDYQGITDQTAPDTVAKTVWATCQHSGGPGQQALNFFGWHRMYLYYFERVLRWASGDDTLRLPYWDYTDPTQLALPAEFRQASAVVYDAKRNPGMNAGTSSLRAGSTNVNALLKGTDYFKYESGIEEGVHGYVHCTVGPTCPVAHMGDVPLAGNDPVFYHHHANIDRLWACWQGLHGTPGGAWQQQKFSFVDETGTMQTKPVSFVVDASRLGYVYDNATSCSRPSTTLAAAAPRAAAGGARALVHKSSAVPITKPQTVVDLDIPPARLAAAVGDLDRAAPVELVLRDVTAASHPGVLFDVFLAKKGSPDAREHVGTISWFGAFRHHGTSGPVKKTLTYDVTDALRALGGAELRETGLTVIVEATDGRDSSDPATAAASRTSAAAAFRAESKLSIGAIELQAAPLPPS